MISIITSHHDEAFAEHDVHALHPREELLEYAALQREGGLVQPMQSGKVSNGEGFEAVYGTEAVVNAYFWRVCFYRRFSLRESSGFDRELSAER